MAISFEISFARKNEMIAEMTMTVRIVINVGVVISVSCLIATAAPVRVFWSRYSVMNENVMTRVLIDPRRIRNWSSSCSLI